MTQTTEERLIRWLRERTRPLVGWLLVVSGTRERADDLFQEVCLEAWRSRYRFRPESDLGAFIHGIARNVVMRDQRRRQRDRLVAWPSESLDDLEASWNRSFLVRDEPEDARPEALAHCIESLEPSDRDLLRRVYHDRATHDVVAEETGRTRDAVKMLTLRLRKKLRACVDRRLQAEQADAR